MDNEPSKLKRYRNLIDPEKSCGEVLRAVLKIAPTIDEAADEIGISRQTLIRWRRMYGLPVKEPSIQK